MPIEKRLPLFSKVFLYGFYYAKKTWFFIACKLMVLKIFFLMYTGKLLKWSCVWTLTYSWKVIAYSLFYCICKSPHHSGVVAVLKLLIWSFESCFQTDTRWGVHATYILIAVWLQHRMCPQINVLTLIKRLTID